MCVSACKQTISKKFLTTPLWILGGKPSLWPKDEVIWFWEKLPWDKDVSGGGQVGGQREMFAQ